MTGVVSESRKLVVSAGGVAQLYDLEQADPDEVDLAVTEPQKTAELLEALAGSPVDGDGTNADGTLR